MNLRLSSISQKLLFDSIRIQKKWLGRKTISRLSQFIPVTYIVDRLNWMIYYTVWSLENKLWWYLGCHLLGKKFRVNIGTHWFHKNILGRKIELLTARKCRMWIMKYMLAQMNFHVYILSQTVGSYFPQYFAWFGNNLVTS